MAYYAKLDENNIVLRVESVADSDCLDENGIENEEVGRQFLENVHGWTTWKKCSYNTKDGVHYDIDYLKYNLDRLLLLLLYQEEVLLEH